MEEKSIAYELLQEVKRTNKRLFIICLVELAIIISMVVGFLIYESQYDLTSEEYTQETEDIYSSNVMQSINEGEN